MTWGRMAIFLGFVSVVTALIHAYLWLRLVRGPAWPPAVSAAGTVVLVLLGSLIPLSFVASRVLPKALATPLAFLAYGWMGAMFLFLVLVVAGEVVRLGVTVADRLGVPALADEGRRLFLARLLGAGTLLTGSALGLVSTAHALGPLRTKRVRVPIRALPGPLKGLRIVQLTDIHVGPTIGRAFVESVVTEANRLDADLIAITGDLVDGSVAELADGVSPLARLRARHGVYFVTGNHEYYSGAASWCDHLTSLGIRVLRNEHVTIEHGGASFDLVGIDDPSGGQFLDGHGSDLAGAVAGSDPSRVKILLSHQPKTIDDAAEHGIALQISGHTHGGQIYPFNYLVKLEQPYVSGLHDHRGTQIYVSNGTGYWGPPMRLGIPAEITLLELIAAPGERAHAHSADAAESQPSTLQGAT